MSELSPFSGDRLCSKCGHDDIATHYQAEGTRSLGDFFSPERGERLDRRCARCGFYWAEQVVRQADEPPEAERFEAGKAYRLKAEGFRNQRAIVFSVRGDDALGLWWDGDSWRRPHSQRGDWEELR